MTEYERVLRTIVVVPTFNEAENIRSLLILLYELNLGLSVIVVDDNSADRTQDIVRSAMNESEWKGRLQLLSRPNPTGLGDAYRAGILAALDLSADVVVQMDADLSHPASIVPELIRRVADGNGLAIGSRYVPGGSIDASWSLRRRLLSKFANIYVSTVLNLGIKDATAGFNCWRADVLRDVDVGSMSSQGYSFQVESKFRARKLGAKIVEVPIHFTERQAGQSKMTLRTQIESAIVPLKLRFGKGLRRHELR